MQSGGRLHDAGHVFRRDDCRMLDMLSGWTTAGCWTCSQEDDCMMLDMSSGGTTAGCWTCQEGLTTARCWTCRQEALTTAGCWTCVRMDDCRMLDMSGGTDDCRMLDMPSGGIAVHRADCKVKPMWPSRGGTTAASRYR